jgi:hypothetical protein
MMRLCATLSLALSVRAQDSGRDLLFSDPTANLPDVKISESVKYVNEGSSFYYTVELTHAPGMREDQTIDRTNDEVRIYLSSSQEVYQQGVAAQDATADDFVQTLGHRTQLVIDTNVVKCTDGTMGRYTDPDCFSNADSTSGAKLTDGQCLDTATGTRTSSTWGNCQDANERFEPTHSHIMGPLPYVYVAYSTKNPSQPSTLDAGGTNYNVVCPLCTHTKWCTMHATDIITGSNADDGADVANGADADFAGCLQVTYTGFAPFYDACYAGVAGATPADPVSGESPTTIALLANRVAVTADGATQSGPEANKIKHCFTVPILDFDGVSHSRSGTLKLLLEPTPMGRGYLDDADATNFAAGVLSPPLAIGGVGSQAKDLVGYTLESANLPVSTTLMPGSSDFRITASGKHPTRRIPDYSPYCRYCEMPGIACHTTAGAARPCPDIEVNGGDTAPGSCTISASDATDGNVDYADATPDLTSKYDCEAKSDGTNTFEWNNDAASYKGWRGDVTSGAQLVFDSTNWNIAQTVKVTARDDDVYEPEVFGRGQDAYVHHYVVAQDVNLQHTYYDDIDVNSLTVSITDNDAAVVLEMSNSLTPTELGAYGAASTTSVMAANAVAAAHSTGCTDPKHKDYNKCLAAKSCTGPCDDDAIGAVAATAGGALGTYTLTVAVDAAYSVGDTVLVTDGGSCAIAGTYTIAAIASDSSTVTFNEPFTVAAGTVTDCSLERAAPTTVSASQEGATAPDTCLVSLYTTEAACEAVAVGQCFVDALGSALAGSQYSTEALCEGHDGSSTAGTCVGSGPSTSSLCVDSTLEVGGTGSACTTKDACTNAGFTWHPAGYVWIGATGASTLTWGYNKWGGAKTGATSVPNAADEIVLQLASEPMYDVTVYVQSGPFFSTASPTSPEDFLPDDEQVIYQDKGQATTCVLAADGKASDEAGVLNSGLGTGADSVKDANTGYSVPTPCVADATTVPMCDPTGYFVSSQQYLDRRAHHATVVALPLASEGSATEGLSPGASTLRSVGGISPTGPTGGLSATGFTGLKLPTKGHDAESCATLTTEADCVAATNAGCAWSSGCTFTAFASGQTKLTAMDLQCFDGPPADEAACLKKPGCAWDATGTAGCYAHRTGFTCNSFLTFSPTNWNVPQTLMAIAVPDDDDETPSGTCASSTGVVDYSITTSEACARASKTWTASPEPSNTGATPYGVDPSETGYLIVSDDWYYNSDGAELIDDYNAVYHPVVDGATGYCTTTATGLIDFTKTTQSDCDTGGTQTWQWTGPAAGVKLSMFDTRFGDHINRYPFTRGDTLEYGAGTSSTIANYDDVQWALGGRCADVAYSAADTSAALIGGARVLTSGQVRHGCPIRQGVRGTPSPSVTITAVTAADPAVATVAATTLKDGDRVRVDGINTDMGTVLNGKYFYVTVTAGTSGVDATEVELYTDSARSVGAVTSSLTAATAGTMNLDFTAGHNKVCVNKDGYFDGAGAHSSTQVGVFSPSSYAGDGVVCGATSYTQDKNARGVVISRSACEATEGRRHFYQGSTVLNRQGANMLENPTSLGNQLGLWIPRGDAGAPAANAAAADSISAGTYMDDWAMARTLASSASAAQVAAAIGTSCEVTVTAATGTSGIELFRVGDSIKVTQSAAECDDFCDTAGGCLYEIATLTTVKNLNAADQTAVSTMTFVGKTSCSAVADATGCLFQRLAATAPTDGWTSNYANDVDGGAGSGLVTMLGTYDVDVAVMSMPVCPFTIALTSAPAEGATVVVKVGEDENLASLRDNELYFFEEPTFRLSEKGSVAGSWSGAIGPFSIVTAAADIPQFAELDPAATPPITTSTVATLCERQYPGSVTAWASKTDEATDTLCYINNVGSAVDASVAVDSVTAGTGADGTTMVGIAPATGTAWDVLSAAEVPKIGDTIVISPTADDNTCDIAGTYTVKSTTCTETAGPPATYSCTELFVDQPLVPPAAVAECSVSKPYRPNGGKSINVKFTDDDWNVPRRITVIALNDDVDEPPETRKVYFKNGWSTSGTWQGVGDGPGVQDADCENCIEDPFYRDTIIGTVGTTGDGSTDGTLTDTTAGPPQYTATGQYATGSSGGTPITSISASGIGPEPVKAAQVTVDVVDDDIADLVVLCGANGGMPGAHTAGVPAATAAGFGMNSGEALDFIGSYDDALTTDEANEILGLEIDGTINRIGADAGLGPDGKNFLGGAYDTGAWVADVTTVGASANIEDETLTIDTGKGALFAVGDRIQIKSCPSGLAGGTGFHTITSVTTTAITAQALTAADADAQTMTTADPIAAGFEVGDRIVVTDGVDDGNVCGIEGLYTVRAVSATTITTEENFRTTSTGGLSSAVDCFVGRAADTLGFAEGAFGYVAAASAAVADASACTIQGAVKRVGYAAEDGMSAGVQYSFGGGIVPGVAAASFGGALTTRSPITSTIICAKYNRYDADGALDSALTTTACQSAAAVQDGCVLDTSCKGGVGAGGSGATGYDIVLPAAGGGNNLNSLYPDTAVDWASYDPYSDRYLLADGKTPAGHGAWTTSTGGVGSFEHTIRTTISPTHHNRGFKGVGPALDEGPDNYACTIHTRECKYNPPKDASISDTHTEDGFCYTTADRNIIADSKGTCDASPDTKSWGYWVDSSGIDSGTTEPEDRDYGKVGTTAVTGDKACESVNVGSFKIRLNSSPGQKTVKRQYIGETATVYEKELVYVVVTPDATPQTQFEPASVTFTETGGMVNGVATQRWDAPATIEVRPVDDNVDERRGVTVDFTAFSIKQSHEGDDYWTYSTPYMNIPVNPSTAAAGGSTCVSDTELGYCANPDYTCGPGSSTSDCNDRCKTACEAAGFAFETYPSTGSAHAWGDLSSFRAVDHTPYRHTIRTVHTHDNDFAGVTVKQPTGSSGTDLDVAEDPAAGQPGSSFAVAVTEGGTFGYYTIELDTQPAAIQRQAGTSPNKDIAFSAACDHDGAATDVVYKAGGYAGTFDGANYGDYYFDNTKLMRSSHALNGRDPAAVATARKQCGSVVPPEYYWVDVTATQTIQLDLATPASCPTITPWGGGSDTDLTTTVAAAGFASEHRRFPFNGRNVIGDSEVEPYDEVNHRDLAMNNYLTTCGGWQRDATYRFTAKDWNVPQYVYFYAHNDKDGVKAVTAIAAQALSAFDAAAFTLTTATPDVNGFKVGDKIRVVAASGASCGIAGLFTAEAVSGSAITVVEPITGSEDTAADCEVERVAVTGGDDGIGAEVVDSGLTTYATTIKHYVETEDTQDNMAPAAPIAAVAATGISGNTVTVAVDAGFQVGDRVRIVENAVGTDCDVEGEYTIAAIAADRSTVTFAETMSASTDATHCSLVGATGRCTDQGSQTAAQAAAKGQGACSAAGGQWTPSFVQRNKHGGIYTYGNRERYPFGRKIPFTDSQNALAYHHETGFTTYGYSSYETLYGYTAAGAITNAIPGVYDAGQDAVGANIGTDCGATEMGVTTQTQASALWDGGTIAAAPQNRDDMRLGQGKVSDNTGAAAYLEPGTTTACTDKYGIAAPFQWSKHGLPCVPAADNGGTLDLACVPRFAEASTAEGVNGFPGSGNAIILATTGSGDRRTTGTGGGYEQRTATGTALNNPPVDVVARVTDNDDITEQATSAVEGCRATQLFQYADSTGSAGGQQTSAVAGRGVFKKEWLTDYNCDSGDAGGLPGYPLSPTRSDGTAIDGYCTDGVQTSESACIAEYFCTVAGSCSGSAPASARTEEECGVCSTTSGEPTATDRFTETECVKDSDGDDTADGTWTAATWSTSDATEANCASVLGGVWKARTWVPAPKGDATTAWLPVKAAAAATAATAHAFATKTFSATDASNFVAGDRVTVSAVSGSVCGTASADCTICGTYHIASKSTNDVVFLEAFTSQLAGDATACELARPAVTLATLDNKQCCSCVPAVGSTVSAATLAVHATETECTKDSAGDRLGGTWKCSGVGPYCTAD